MQEKKSPSFTDLFLTFFWIGLTAFGGLAMTAHIRKNIVDKRNWMDSQTFDSGLALCQVIPGAIVMQFYRIRIARFPDHADPVCCL
jgi:chromate transporter